MTRLWAQWRRQPRRALWKRIGRTLALLAGAAGAVALSWSVPELVEQVRHHPYFRVETLEIQGNRRVAEQELLHWVEWKRGCSVWDVDPRALRDRLLQHPWIRGVTVRRVFPRWVHVRVQERRPTALLLSRGVLQYIDRTGKVLGPVPASEAPDLPVISGVDELADRDLSPVHVHRALQLLRTCERLRCADQISQIHIGRRGLIVVPEGTRTTVVLGWTKLAEKLRRSARIFAAWEGRPERLQEVDVSFPRVAVVKLAPTEKKGQPRRSRQRAGRTEA
ncbi:MAG: hypothetical protein KatS3mg077_2801 [Candidatus Binatia bacterium]|nr:MAG: hypothetical protein KatS3mg077_2801 [Candidatus Binatia bacterium]